MWTKLFNILGSGQDIFLKSFGEVPRIFVGQPLITLVLFGISVETSQDHLKKISEIYFIQKWRYPRICLISVRKKQTNRLTDIQEI